jgi:YVTN family beta-propeller protein
MKQGVGCQGVACIMGDLLLLGMLAQPKQVQGLENRRAPAQPLVVAQSTTTPRPPTSPASLSPVPSAVQVAFPAPPTSAELDNLLPGMPPLLDPYDIYAATRTHMLSPVVQNFPTRVYVPNSDSHTVDVIDPTTFKVIDSFPVGKRPQHVTPSYDLKTLWVLNNEGYSLTKIDPATGKKGDTVPVDDPYNMYYTPDGKYAVVIAEALQRLDFREPDTMKLVFSLPVACRGVDHLDFSANGRYFIASCEFAGKVIKVDVVQRKVVGTLRLRRRGQPQDVKLSPDGLVFYVADMKAHGVYMIDGESLTTIGFLPTGNGAHGLYASRDSTVLYVSNRGEGSVSVIDFATRKVARKWRFGGSPDMGGVSTDGKVLWLAGRHHAEVYAIDTTNGTLLARIPVGKGPHGLCVYPQPGRYSLGHTGVFR